MGITSVQNAILCSWSPGILWLYDVIWRWSFIPSTSKCGRHIQYSRYITPWNCLAKHQLKVSCAALKSRSLSLCTRSARVSVRSHGSFDLALPFTVSTVSTLLCPPILTKCSLVWGDASSLFFRLCKHHTQSKIYGKSNNRVSVITSYFPSVQWYQIVSICHATKP